MDSSDTKLVKAFDKVCAERDLSRFARHVGRRVKENWLYKVLKMWWSWEHMVGIDKNLGGG